MVQDNNIWLDNRNFLNVLIYWKFQTEPIYWIRGSSWYRYSVSQDIVNSFARVLHSFLMKDILVGRWLRWMLPGSTGQFYKNDSRSQRFCALMLLYITRVEENNYIIVCLSCDNVQHELQRWSLINIPEKRRPPKQKETYGHSLTPFWTYFRLELYLLHLLSLLLPSPYVFYQGQPRTISVRNHSAC